MIKYPNNNNEKVTSSLQEKVNSGEMKIGERIFINDNSFTLVHIDGDKYIFSMDELVTECEQRVVPKILKEIYETGKYNNLEIFPRDVLENIDFLFIPTEKQVFGRNEYGETENESVQPFDWFKKGAFTTTKSLLYRNNYTSFWWLSTMVEDESEHCCSISSSGYADFNWIGSSIGMPVFFQITKK